MSDEIRKIITKPKNIIPFLVPGRLLHIKTEQDDWGWGILSNISKQRITAKNKQVFKGKRGAHLSDLISQSEVTYILDMYLYCKDKLTMDQFLQPGNVKELDGKMGIVPVVLHHSTVCNIATI